jgi:glycosyltransferase involved in cell wall biosynthesis
MTRSPLCIGVLAAELTHAHGWAHYCASLLPALARAGVQVIALAPTGSPALAVDGLTVHAVLPPIDALSRRFLVRTMGALPTARRLLHECALIHAAVEPYAPMAAALAGDRPLVVTAHGSYVRLGAIAPRPAGRVYAGALARSTLACVSHYTERQAQAALPGAATVVIPNGVDVERFAALPTLPRSGALVLSVGAVKRRKGTLTLIRAMAQVRDQRPDARAVIVGSLEAEPETAAQAQAEIAALGLERTVTLAGRVPEEALLRWYAQADVFALPSLNDDWKFEGFGLALLEASAAGLPVIGSRECGAEDAVEDGVTGLLIPQQESVPALAQAILTLLNDPARRAQMGAAGRARAAACIWDRAAQALLALYQRLTG